MSKGSGRRPQEADDKHVSSEWDRLFNKKDEYVGNGFGLARVKCEGDVESITLNGEYVPSHVYEERTGKKVIDDPKQRR